MYEKIILVTDSSKSARAASETALNLCRQHGSKLWIVDTIRRPSRLATWLSGNASDLFDLMTSDKQSKLDRIAQSFQEADVETETKLLIGNSSEEVARLAIDEQSDLVIRYTKGSNSRMAGPFGNTARNLMRVCPCPLLLVAESKPVADPKVLACVNAEHDDLENDAILAAAGAIAGSDNFDLLYCWDFNGSEYLTDYVSQEMMKQYIDDSERNYQAVFEKFLSKHNLSLGDSKVHMKHGDATNIIPAYCQQHNIDVVVMSSASQNHPLYRLLGSTMESMLDRLSCNLLVVKPVGYQSPLNPSTANVTGV